MSHVFVLTGEHYSIVKEVADSEGCTTSADLACRFGGSAHLVKWMVFLSRIALHNRAPKA